MLTVGSLFSGVGGFDLGFVRAGFDVRWQCEIDRDCRDVLCRQFPETEVIYSNILTMPLHEVERVDVLIGGFPCQDLSVAGKRAGLDGSRSGLFFEFARVIERLRPTFVVMENVPGLLSSNGGRDMAVILGTLSDIGATDIAWCVLDAQWFGVPQRRRRVFLVCDFAGERASEILSLSEGLQGNPAPRRETGKDVAGTLGGGSGSSGKHRYDLDSHGAYIAGTVSAKWAKGTGGPAGDETYNLVMPALTVSQGEQSYRGGGTDHIEQTFLPSAMGVRRLTPTECERLMGWPDGHTAYGASGKRMSDSTQYRMAGNGVVSNVAEWIARRIAMHGQSVLDADSHAERRSG